LNDSGHSFFSRLLDGLAEPLCVVDRSGSIAASNAAFALLAGHTRAELQGMALCALLPDADAPLLRARLACGDAAEAAPLSTSIHGLTSATRVHLRVLGAAEPAAERVLVGAAVIGDGSAEQRALHELSAIVDNALVGVMFTRDRVVRNCNRRVAEIFGFDSPEALIGQPAVTVYPSVHSYERLGREAGPLLGSGRPFQCEWTFRKADGRPVRCKVYGKAVDPAHNAMGTVWIFEELSAARRSEQALQLSMRETEAIMRNAPLGIVFTRQRRILRYNGRFAEMYGFDGDEAVGVPARVLFRSDEEYDAFGEMATPLLSKGKPIQRELFMRRQDGSDFWANVIGYVQNLDDTSEATIWTCEDRSAQKRAEEALQHANAELALAKERAEVANRAKSTFLSSMSHELRTPLNAILGYAQILRLDQTLGERQQKSVATIEQAGQHLLALIDDVLDVARIEAGKLDLHPETVLLVAFLRAVGDIVRVRAEQKQLRFVLDAPPGLPRAVQVDERRLRQVLLNLLGNAVKFTDRGQVELLVQVEPAPQFRARLRFEIRDTGVGIDMSDAPRLFRPFEQVGEARRRSNGTGLGLAISRELVRAMGGDIEVEGRPGAGSAFRFAIEVPVVGNEIVGPRRQAVVGYRGPRRKLLVVDDVAHNRALLVDFLKLLDFALDEAGDGGAALERAAAARPDLILMDNVMPGMSGLEAARRLRGHPALRDVPIIAISASASSADRKRSLAAGVDAFLNKPIDLDELLDHVATLLQLTWVHSGEADAPTA
jgi:PAS domain S-box-containing protein